jgi:glycosyltransferase involved in cell wall biosynthesis
MRNPREDKILSIAVLTYNRSKMLDELLQSVSTNSKETLNRIEVLILDNGSTDNTSEIIERYSSLLDIKKIREEINIRGSIRYKQLIEFSHGKFIIFPGDDDIFIERKFDDLISILEKTSDEVSIIAAAAKVIDQQKNLLRIEYKPKNIDKKSEEIAELFEKSIYWLPATFIRTSTINNLKAPNSLTAFDWYLWITAATNGKTKTISQEVIKYRQHLEKEQNSFLQNNWDIDELLMFIFTIQQGAIHEWIKSTSDLELQHFFTHLNKITNQNNPRTISSVKYILLMQEIAKHPKFQKSIEVFKVNNLNSMDPRFLQAILGYSLSWRTFKYFFEDLGFAFEIDLKYPELRDGIYIYKTENKFQLRILSQGKQIYEGILSENDLLYKISDYYNEIMRDIRNLEVDNQITKFEWRAVNTIRKIKKLRYGKTVKLKRRK